MTLGKIFLVVVLAVITAIVIIKYWKVILSGIALVAGLILTVVLVILCLPLDIIRVCYMLCARIFIGISTEEMLYERIAEQYDVIFFKAETKKDLAKRLKNVAKLERELSAMKRKKSENEWKNILNECKWVL